MAYWKTNLYFGNNTDYSVNVNTVKKTGSLSWRNYPSTTVPRNGDKNKVTGRTPIAKFNRNKKSRGQFITTLSVEDKNVTFHTNLIDGSIVVRFLGPGGKPDTGWTNDYDAHTFQFTLDNGQIILAQYRNFNKGVGKDDVYIVLNQDLPKNYVDNDESENVLTIITYNTWMPRHKKNKASIRKDEIPYYLSPFDVIVLEETFNDDFRNDMRNMLRRSHPYWTGPLNPPPNFSIPIYINDDGGVVILSKWPFAIDSEGDEVKDSIKYSQCPCGWNQEHKGAWYVKILKNNTPYHIFATHTVWDKKQTEGIVTLDQISELGAFVRRKNIPSNEPVIIAGDMNVFQRKSVYTTMLERLDVNNVVDLVNSILNATNDESRNSGAEGGTGTLDYILYSRSHKQPVSSFCKIIPMISPQTNDPHGELLGKYLSDHFAKYGYFSF